MIGKRILSEDQAKHIYDAMCVLNNVYGTIMVRFKDPAIEVFEEDDGSIRVAAHGVIEKYGSQNDFVKAYGIG